jgi:7-keto-8-aminopelargonate synthetase-like enzyme
MNNDSVTSPPLMESPPGPRTVIDGVEYHYFAGTSYLGVHGDPRVIEAGCAALRRFGVHTATSRSGFGNSRLVLDVEQATAKFMGTEDAFYFSSGYAANHVAVQALVPEVDAVYLDACAHYSVQEAARVIGKPVYTFDHLSASSLRSTLRKGIRPLVLADGVVSSTGRILPVAELIEVLQDSSPAILHLDDAHAFGVLGLNGRGTFDHFGYWQHVNGGPPIGGVKLSVCGTLAKAIGGFGGVIPGTKEFVQRIRTSSHYYDGASAPASPLAACSLEGLRICQSEPDRRERLRSNVRQLRAGLRQLGYSVSDEPTPNVGVVIRDAKTMRKLHIDLKARGFLVPYVASYPAIGTEGLMRIAVCSEHTPLMIDQLLKTMSELLQ